MVFFPRLELVCGNISPSHRPSPWQRFRSEINGVPACCRLSGSHYCRRGTSFLAVRVCTVDWDSYYCVGAKRDETKRDYILEFDAGSYFKCAAGNFNNQGGALAESIQKEAAAVFETYEQQGVFQLFADQGITREDFEKYISIIVTIKRQITPAFLAILGMLEISLGYVNCRLITKQGLRNFSLWSLPWYAVWIVIIGLASYLGGDFLGNQLMAVFGINLMIVMAAICVILGLSCLTYFYKRIFKIHVLIIASCILGTIFLFSLFTGNPFLMAFLYFIIISVMIVALFIGLFDLLFNFRGIPDTIKEGK